MAKKSLLVTVGIATIQVGFGLPLQREPVEVESLINQVAMAINLVDPVGDTDVMLSFENTVDAFSVEALEEQLNWPRFTVRQAEPAVVNG